MKIKSYLMSQQESNAQPEQPQHYSRFKTPAELRKWFYEEHSPEFYRRLRQGK